MNKIVELQKLAEEISSDICSFCKPLMLNKAYSKEVRQLLSSETDLRMSIEMIMEVESKKEAQEKIQIAKEESQIILYFLERIQKITPKNPNLIIEKTKHIIEVLNAL